MKSNTITTDENSYLQRLKLVALSPKIVHKIGEIPAVATLSIAIVGTRQPTAYGKRVSFEFAYKLAQQGIIIISGLAYGIDAAAHNGALAANGKTIAVLAHGLDTLYPPGHARLSKQIIDQGGCLLSEYPDGTPIMKHRFLERNRIVSGLADALLVIEAGEKSGTYSTIQYALQQGKEVFAVPGPIDSPASTGTNRLIQQGAHPALHPQDILERIAPGRVIADTLPEGDSPQQTRVLQLIYGGTTQPEQLQIQSKLTPSEYMQTVTLLEIRGRIERLTSGEWNFRK
jgi:DNA processing protein